jgi:excisionase family DNA binding protein
MTQKTNKPEKDELLTVDEVASIFKVSPATVRKWRSNKEGPRGFRAGKYVRYRQSAVDTYIAEKEKKENYGI